MKFLVNYAGEVMKVLNQLDAPNFKTSKSDKHIIEYIKGNADKIIYMSISEVAREANIGETTVTRFAKKMGFSGFQDFKVTLAKDVSLESRIINNEDVLETVNKLLKNNINQLERMKNKF